MARPGEDSMAARELIPRMKDDGARRNTGKATFISSKLLAKLVDMI
jgi:hypothetical protein